MTYGKVALTDVPVKGTVDHFGRDGRGVEGGAVPAGRTGTALVVLDRLGDEPKSRPTS